VRRVSEISMTDSGELDLGVPRTPHPVPAAAELPGEPDPAGLDREWIDRGWVPGDHGDPELDPADDEAWLAGLPADIRADFLAGAWTGNGDAIPAGFLHHLRSGPSGVGFAAGGMLDGLAPGPWLSEAVSMATAAGHDQLGESELIGVLCAWRRMSSWAAAGEAAAVSALARRRAAQSTAPGKEHLAEHISDEIAASLTLTGRAAGRLLSMSNGLARLPDVLAALESGEVDWPKACQFVIELDPLTDDTVAQAIAARLLGRAGPGGWTTGQLQAGLRRAVLAADPDALVRRREEARKDAEVQSWDEASGNAALAGRELPPADVIAAGSRLTALAVWLQHRGAVGTISQLRAAVYLALINGRPLDSLLPKQASGGSAALGADAADAESAQGDSPAPGGSLTPAAGLGWPAVSGTVNLTMPLSAFLGSGRPGEVAGHGPVDAATARELAEMLAAGSGAGSGAAKWCLTVTGADGRAVGHACAPRGPVAGEPVVRWAAGLRAKLQLLETGKCSHGRQSRSYQPPNSLRHLVQVRQRTCSFRGCRRAAVRCDLDHTVPFDQGGRTCECNLAPLCRRHHRAKQAPGWHLQQSLPGQMTWQLPSGRTYRTAGEVYVC
jgi:hypothetical protein